MIRALQTSSLLVTNYRRQRNSMHVGTNAALPDQETDESPKISSNESNELSSPSSSTDFKKKYSRQDTYFGTFFGTLNGKSILEHPENKI